MSKKKTTIADKVINDVFGEENTASDTGATSGRILQGRVMNISTYPFSQRHDKEKAAELYDFLLAQSGEQYSPDEIRTAFNDILAHKDIRQIRDLLAYLPRKITGTTDPEGERIIDAAYHVCRDTIGSFGLFNAAVEEIEKTLKIRR